MNKLFRKLTLGIIGCFSLIFSGCSLAKPSVKLNHEELPMTINEEKQLYIESVKFGGSTLDSNKYSCIFTSSNSSIAKVNAQTGFITALEEGSCEIKANLTIADYDKNPYVVSCHVVVDDPAPVSIELSKDNAKVRLGKTLQLTANVTHTSNKNVSWSSDNEDVEVNSNGLVIVKPTAHGGDIATITATSIADQTAKATCIIKVVDSSVKEYDYTIMLYMCGSTLENDGTKRYAYPALFSEDIQELLNVVIPENIKVIIETGGTTKWGLDSKYILGATSISSSHLQRWEVVDQKIKLVETLATNHMADPISYQNFLEWGLENYDAEQIGVIISSHGSGVGGCALDDNYMRSIGYSYIQNSLNTEELAVSTRNALANTGHEKITWMGFDCCIMGVADLASVLCDYFDYMVASQESELGEGWDHDTYLAELVKDPKMSPQEFLPIVCKSFVDEKHDLYCSYAEPCLQQLAAFDLSKMNKFTTDFNNYVIQTGNGKTELDQYKVAFKASYNQFADKIYGLADFASYLGNLKTQFPSVEINNLLNDINDLVMYNYWCSRYTIEPCGVNAFFPLSLDNRNALQVAKSDYKGNFMTRFTPYQEMCLLSRDWAFQ